MASTVASFLQNILLPKRTAPDGISSTPTFNPSATGTILTAPTFREHTTDIFSQRTQLDSRALLQQMFRTDPDMSAAVNAFLTVADTWPVLLVKDINGQLDPAGQALLLQILAAFFTRSDYTTGFQIIPTMNSLAEACRYMILLRGAVGGELIINKEFIPVEFRMQDMGKVFWYEPKVGKYFPQQLTLTGNRVSLDIPNFFVAWYRRDPTGINTYSPFVSAINTIAARQQVINDLYRIMTVTGYPRMEITILEEVLMKNAPIEAKTTVEEKTKYLNGVISGISGSISLLRPDQAFIHTDSLKTETINHRNPGMAINVDSVIQTLNAQNQAGLKTMATIIGRGESGVNTASVESRIFSLSAQAINEPIGDLLSQAFTLALRLQGSTSYVHAYFQPVEMRSDTELETQKLVQSQRLKEDLSLGLITDDEYHLMVYNRLPGPGIVKLSGTNFKLATQAGVDTTAISPNGTPVGRAATAPGGNKPARDNKIKVGGK